MSAQLDILEQLQLETLETLSLPLCDVRFVSVSVLDSDASILAADRGVDLLTGAEVLRLQVTGRLQQIWISISES